MASKKKSRGFGTLSVTPAKPDKNILAHIEPLFATTAYGFTSMQHALNLFEDPSQGYIYSRWDNPTVHMAAQKIADMEAHGSEFEACGYMFSSGMAAITAVLTSCAQSGDAILTQPQLYGTTDELMQKQLAAWNITIVRADLNNADAVERIFKKNKKIKLVYLETPSNPMMEVVDIQLVASIAHQYGCKVAVDNTFASPYCQKPLQQGADLVVHSATKYLNGHGNGLGGVVVGRDKRFMQEHVWTKIKLLGANHNPFESWLLLQGMKTLEIRMQRHCDNAAAVAAWLSTHDRVKKVLYCGLPDHPQAKIIAKQMTDYSGMLSFELKGGLQAGKRLLSRVKLCQMITTLGTLDTLIQHPASMTHVNVPKERRLASGITDGLVRMSIGIENIQDILNDLEYGLK